MENPEKHVTIKEEPEEAKLPSPANPPWNAEEDHLLSYFLDADSAGRRRSSSDLSANNNPSPRIHHHPASNHPGAPTMTPAVHFYTGASHKPPAPPKAQHPAYPQGQQQRPQPDSSLSMASMAAALVGGPVFPPPGAKEEDSTISPTADLITGSHENLMLPPPQGQTTEAEKQQHLQWLQQINAMAVMARHQPVPNGVPMPAAPGIPSAAAAPNGFPPLPPHHHHHHHAMYPPVPAAETEEKRARRLARNRESARASRRRKKERLATLEKQVTSLFSQVETQRREKIMEMEQQLQARRAQELSTLSSRQALEQFLQETGPNTVVRERVATFQYEKLRQLLLPRHHEFLLWLTLQQDEFFTTAKNTKASLANNKAGRVSSKQIGEELTNETKKSRKKSIEEDEDKVTSAANDVDRMWPLLCFELLVSVDQEERLTSTQRSSREMPSLPDERRQMALATRMATNVRKGVLFQAHAASMRANTTLLDILTPEQSVKYLQWMSTNRAKCRETIDARRQSKSDDMNMGTSSLSDICKRLDEVLRFPKGDGTENGATETG